MDSERAGDGRFAESLTPVPDTAIIAPPFCTGAQEEWLARRISALQALVTVLAAGGVYVVGDRPQALAVLGGGGAAIINSGLLAWRMYRTARQPTRDPRTLLRRMYFFAVERYLAVAAMLMVCMALWRLPPLAVAGGFVLGQVVLLVAHLLLRIRTESR